jgi:non-specific serine/threonine protein kinase
MLAVHAFWTAPSRLAVWAEQASPSAGRRRAGRPPRERPHPFAAAAPTLAAVLGGAGRTGTRRLWLPTRGSTPVDSPDLVRTDMPETAGAADPPRLAIWLVETLEFDADDAYALLRSDPPADVIPGAALRHLAALAAYAADLADRGRVLPVVERSGSAPSAVWRPVLTAADLVRARDFVAASPPAARAEATDVPATAAQRVGEALDALTDAAVRSLIGVPIVAGRRTGGIPAATWSWLRALTGRDRGFEADDRAVGELDRELAAWRADAAGGPVRACFRLVEPIADGLFEDDTDWRVEFALQPTDEPSLMIPAERIWRTDDDAAGLERHIDDPQETMLAELGRASRLWPAIERALAEATPAELVLDVDDAHRFLRDGAPLLHAAGFGVLLPSWWSKPSARLGVRLHATSRPAPGTVARDNGFGLDSILDYRWRLAIGDDELTEEELSALADLKAPLVRIRGQWVELDAKRLASALRLITSGGRMSVGELLHAGLAADEGPGGLPITAVTADGALGELLSGTAEQRLVPVDPPPGFRGTLRPYQKRGLSWLSFLESLGLGGVLADDMGLGKTVQLLALFASDPADAGPTLLVCPMSLVGNWRREAAKFAPDLRVHVHHGAERARGDAFAEAVAAADVVVTTYGLAARDAADLAAIGWRRIVVDEAQAIKNAATRQSAAVRALPARVRFAVTGTPVENRLADLWSILDFASPGLLGGAAAFKRAYAEPIERHGDDEAAARLRRVTRPFILRRVKTDTAIIADLPEKLEMDVLCNLTAEQASLYQAVVDDMMDKIDNSTGIERRGLVLATMTKLKQVCNHPAQLLHDDSRLAGRSGKLARLEETLEEVLAAGERALLFTQYASFGGMLRAHLGVRFGREVLFLHGGVGQQDRDAMVARFQAADAGAPALFVLSLKAGGTGLTLTAANHVIHVDRWWNPAVEDQATDRAFRIGQRRAVQVRKFVCAGTVEEKIAGMIADKRGLAAKIVGTGEGWLTELSTSDLRDLFRLESGAVVE